MTDHHGGAHITGSLRSEGGAGVVRLEARFPTEVDDLWTALTDPKRLAEWLGETDGDLRQGADLRGHWHASGWEGTVRIEACDPPQRLLLQTESEDESSKVELVVSADGQQVLLVLEDRGVPLDNIAAYGAGNQIHVEDLAAHLDGHGRCDARRRFEEIYPGWQDLAGSLSRAG